MRFANLPLIIQNAKQKKKRKQKAYLESELKNLENNLENSGNLRKDENPKNDLELTYDHIAEGVRFKKEINKIPFKLRKTTR